MLHLLLLLLHLHVTTTTTRTRDTLDTEPKKTPFGRQYGNMYMHT